MFDAASRLAEGRPAADTVQEYVWACHLLGFQDPDLTLHVSQVRDWYGSEDGIDLSALDADCEALRAVAAATEGVLARQDAQLALMSVAWHGLGAQASRDFLRRHGEASAAAVSAVRTAAESLASLRDRLWHSVDGKVAATMAAEGRGARPEWRAAAQTVATGAGDRATASELVDQEVKPFVANDIRSEWLTAMRSAIAAVADAYDAAVAEVTSEVAVAFDVPGDLGPTWNVPPSDGVAMAPAGVSEVGGRVGAAPVGAAQVAAATPAGAPAAWSAPTAAQPFSAQPPLQEPTSSTALPAEPAAMATPSMPSMGGGGMPDTGSGLSGLGSQLGDMLGGLLGTSQDEFLDSPEIDEPTESDDPDELEELDEDEPEDELDEDEGDDDSDAAEDPEAVPATDAVAEPKADEQPADPLPPAPTETPTEPPPPIQPLGTPPPPEPMSTTGTPCEIAADELPQVGE